ncbi:MAG: CsgG/HfaB family protein, partial [Pirellulaceae bacterium]|nr:CsgG/HfaB family protein [Pirellulaceae bacterium]
MAWIATAGVAFAAERTNLRWAIVTGEELHERGVADLLTAQLSDMGVDLVERDAIGHVLDELKLNASGLVAPERAVEFGKLASAEVVVLVESLPKLAPPLVRLRAIETSTGVRLLDFLTLATTPDQDAETLLAELRRAKETWRTPVALRRYVSVLGVRNEEPGDYLTPAAQTLTTFLEHDLRHTPRVLILERDQLQRLTAERDLTGSELELRAAMLLIEVGIRRDPQGEGYLLHGRLKTLDGQAPKDMTWQSPNQQLDEVRRLLAKQLGQTLEVSPEPAASRDLAREAELFARWSSWLSGSGHTEEAIRAAESAVALCPTDKNYQLAFRSHDDRRRQADNELSRLIHIPDPEERQRTLHRAFWEALCAARRAHEIDLAQIRAAIAARSVFVRTLGTNEDMFLPHVQLWSLDEPPAHREVRAELDRLRWEKYRVLQEYHEGRNESLLGLLVPRLGYVNYFSATPEEFCQTILDVQSQIDAELTRFKPLTIQSGAFVGPNRIPRAHYRARNFRLLADQIRWTAHGGPGSSDDTELRRWPHERLQPLWDALAKHEDPLIRMPGFYGRVLLDGPDSVAAAREIVGHLLDVPDDVYAQIAARHLCASAARKLQQAGELEAAVQGLLDRVEREGDPGVLVPCVWTLSDLVRELPADPQGCGARLLRRLEALPPSTHHDTRPGLLVRTVRDWVTRTSRQPSAATNAPSSAGAWSEYQIRPILLPRPADDGRILLAAHLDRHAPGRPRGEEIVLVWGRRNAGASVERLSLTDGRTRKIGQIPWTAAWIQADRPQAMVTTSPEAVFVSAPTLGLAVVTEQDARVFGPADGAPGDTTLASGWWERGLYLGYSHGLARFDPQQGQFVLLASSHTLDGQGPLDGGEHYAVSDVLADPARGCLWLALVANVSGDRYGIWRYQPAANKFEKVFVPGQTGLLSNLTWNGE